MINCYKKGWVKKFERENQNMERKLERMNDFVPVQSSNQVPHWKTKLDNHRKHQTEAIRKWFNKEQVKIIRSHNSKLGSNPAGMKKEEEKWLKSWMEEHEPAHKELLTELKPKYLLEHQTKLEKHKREMLIKKQKLVKTIQIRVTTTLTTITTRMGIHKDRHASDHERKKLESIKKHEEELRKLR